MLLSIIIPTYNVEGYLNKCLSSIIISDTRLLEQLEVLIVIDGATDRSLQIAQEFHNQYPKLFSVINKKNGNYGSCINAALPLATGKYVKVLDADDYFDSSSFEQYLKELETLDVDLVLNYMTIVDPEYKKTSEWRMSVRERCTISFEEFAPSFQSFFIHHFAYRRSLLLDINYCQTEGISYSDNEWVAKPMVAVNSVYFIPQPFYCYLRGREDQTISRKSKSKSFHSLATMMMSLGKIWSEYEGDSVRKNCLYNLFVKQLQYAYNEFFVSHFYSYNEFREFDRKVTSLYPVIKEDPRLVIKYRSFPIVSFWRADIPVITPLLLYLHSVQLELRLKMRRQRK